MLWITKRCGLNPFCRPARLVWTVERAPEGEGSDACRDDKQETEGTEPSSRPLDARCAVRDVAWFVNHVHSSFRLLCDFVGFSRAPAPLRQTGAPW